MSKIITCPYCYNKFENDDVEYQCENIERSVDGTPKCHNTKPLCSYDP